MQTSARPASGLGLLDSYTPLGGNQTRLYYALREAVPIIDAAIFKTVRLTGGFEVRCADERLQHKLDNFVRNVPVGGNQCGLESFVSTYFEQLLTCGTAVGEMVTDSDGHIAALFNSPLENIELRRASDGVGVDIFSASCVGMPSPVRRPELVLLSVINPQPGEVCGCSMLKGLPFVSGILMKIYKTIGLNWERMGNIRFAVTYKPQNDSLDRAYAKERAMQVAKEWSEAMQTGGAVKDFVAVGDEVAVDVAHVGQPGHHAGAVGIAQASLHAELLVIGWVDVIDFLELLIKIDTLVVHARHLSFSFHHDNALQRSTAHRSRDSVNLRENVTWAQ